jgi:rhomboid protease GluP
MVLPLFLHFGWAHWACNLFSLLAVGLSLEWVAGSVLVVYLFFFTGIASILISLMYHPQAMALGCSGAVFGLWGARVLHSWWPPREPERYKTTLLCVCGLLLTVLPQQMGLAVDHWAHFGGLLAGLLGYALYRLGKTTRVLALVALLVWAGTVSRPPWLPRQGFGVGGSAGMGGGSTRISP